MAPLQRRRERLSPVAVLALAYGAGGLPFSNLAATRLRGVDLRRVGSGTVSGTSLYRVAGFKPLAVAGCLDLAKGAVGAALAGPGRPGLQAGATAMALVGHNWSPLLQGAGGRGLAPALGATLVLAPEGAALLGLGLAGGRLLGETGAGCFWATLVLIPVVAATRGRSGVLTGIAVAAPLLAKRVAGNGRPSQPSLGVYLKRLVLDRDELSSRPSTRGVRDSRGRRHRH